jgi:hypothetical protein
MKLPIKAKRERCDGDKPLQRVGNERTQVEANLHRPRRHWVPSEEHSNGDHHVSDGGYQEWDDSDECAFQKRHLNLP